MVSYAQYSQSADWLFDFLISSLLLCHDTCYELILDEYKSLHGMLKSELVLTHLTKDSTDIEVNISWVQNLKAIVDTFCTEMEVVVLDF